MLTIPADRFAGRSYEDLLAFLGTVEAQASAAGTWRVASISLRVGHLDPLAVLTSIYDPKEWHGYIERPQEDAAVAGAAVVALGTFAGADRFRLAQAWAEEVAARTVVTGDIDGPWAGPQFFAAFGFAPEAEPGADFASATVFLPRWLVARHGGDCVAVANVRVDPGAPVEALAQRVWAAHGKFSSFDYTQAVDPPAPLNLRFPEEDKDDDYEQGVRSALVAIAAGRYQKIVLARSVTALADRPLQPLACLGRLRERFPSCWSFSVNNGAGASFIGATPERLVRLRGGLLRTEALAGTAPRGATPAEDAQRAAALFASDKDRREQGLVLQSIERRLRSLGLEPKAAKRPELVRLSNAQHLRTPVTAEVPSGRHLLEVAAALHPTPATGGQPREAALPEVRPLEGRGRGLYAGALGWFDARGEGELVVALRSGLVAGVQAELWAGAGIVEGSDPAAERRETALKLLALRQALG